MILTLTFTPLVNFFLILLTSGSVPLLFPTIYFVIGSMFASLGTLVILFPSIVNGNIYTADLGVWMHSGLFEVHWLFGMDSLTYVMLIVVMTVSTLVHLYSIEYMSEDPHLPRFISYLSLFTFFMLLLVTSENLVSLFLGWEGVGLCSYLLINFWFTRIAANKAAMKAMIVNRIADLALTIGILVAFLTFQTVDFAVIFGLTPYVHLHAASAVALLLFIGAMGKSAQIGLHTWLPDAMEGPTPVSALIHAATMVTAGVFLIIRCSLLFEATPMILSLITFVGAGTAFMAATSGLMQNDLKKIIAYSTCSQLGYMVFACGLSGYATSFFHLTNHAFFKALLFLSAGAVIHAISGEQDLRRLGGFTSLLPYTYIMFLIGSLALMGFPFLTGFYSKDIILEIAAGTLTLPGTFAYWLGLITAFFTAFYSFRLLYLAFYSASRSPRTYLLHAHELTPAMAFSLAVLAIGSIFFGYMARDLFIGFGTTFWNGVIATTPAGQLSGEFLPFMVKMAPFFGSLLAVFLVFTLTLSYHNRNLRALYRFFSHKWYFDTVYNRCINLPVLQSAYHTIFQGIDKGLLEALGPTGFGKNISRAAVFIARRGIPVYHVAWFLLFTLCVTTTNPFLLEEDPFRIRKLYYHQFLDTYRVGYVPWYRPDSFFLLRTAPQGLWRVGYTGLAHVLMWFRPAVLKELAKVLLLFAIPPILIGFAIVAYVYLPRVGYLWLRFLDVHSVCTAVTLSLAYLYYWAISAFLLGIFTCAYEILNGRSYLARTVGYILSFGWLTHFVVKTAEALTAYSLNAHSNRIFDYLWPRTENMWNATLCTVESLLRQGIIIPEAYPGVAWVFKQTRPSHWYPEFYLHYRSIFVEETVLLHKYHMFSLVLFPLTATIFLVVFWYAVGGTIDWKLKESPRFYSESDSTTDWVLAFLWLVNLRLFVPEIMSLYSTLETYVHLGQQHYCYYQANRTRILLWRQFHYIEDLYWAKYKQEYEYEESQRGWFSRWWNLSSTNLSTVLALLHRIALPFNVLASFWWIKLLTNAVNAPRGRFAPRWDFFVDLLCTPNVPNAASRIVLPVSSRAVAAECRVALPSHVLRSNIARRKANCSVYANRADKWR